MAMMNQGDGSADSLLFLFTNKFFSESLCGSVFSFYLCHVHLGAQTFCLLI